MRTVYIKGKAKFKKHIRRALERSKLKDGIDYVIGFGDKQVYLIWIREDLGLRDFKLAITAKYIWKYRMKFFLNINELIPKEDDNLSETDIDIMKRAIDEYLG